MNRRPAPVVVIGACVCVLVFVSGWVGSTMQEDAQREPVPVVTVTVTAEPSPSPAPSVSPVPAPVVRYLPPPKPKPAKDDDSDDDDDSDEGTNIGNEADKFNKDADGYKPKKDCDSMCQFQIADYGDD